MQFPIFIGLHRSSFLGMAILVAHALAAGVVLFVPWGIPVKLAMLAVTAGSLGWAWRCRRPAVEALRLLDDGRLECRLPGGAGHVEAELSGAATVHPWLTVVPLQVEGRRMSAVLLPDSIAPEDFRRLRVWLKWRADLTGAADGA